MKRNLKQVVHISFVLIVLLVMLFETGCKAKKLEAERLRQEAQKVENAKTTLNLLLTNNVNISIEEQEAKLNQIKAQNISDPDVKNKITQVEQKIKVQKEAIAKQKEQEAKLNEKKEVEKKQKVDLTTQLTQNCDSIATYSKKGNFDVANSLINETLKLFTNDDALVLIIISKSGSNVDYDKPTTAKQYLNYVKDRKENKNKVDKLVLDTQGRVKELELIKKVTIQRE